MTKPIDFALTESSREKSPPDILRLRHLIKSIRDTSHLMENREIGLRYAMKHDVSELKTSCLESIGNLSIEIARISGIISDAVAAERAKL